jgi:hypothetical protein
MMEGPGAGRSQGQQGRGAPGARGAPGGAGARGETATPPVLPCWSEFAEKLGQCWDDMRAIETCANIRHYSQHAGVRHEADNTEIT